MTVYADGQTHGTVLKDGVHVDAAAECRALHKAKKRLIQQARKSVQYEKELLADIALLRAAAARADNIEKHRDELHSALSRVHDISRKALGA